MTTNMGGLKYLQGVIAPRHNGDLMENQLFASKKIRKPNSNLKTEPIVIEVSEFKEVKEILEGSERDHLQKRIREDRVKKHLLSIERVKHWENTIQGQRRRKLQAREERLRAIEAERQRQDADYAKEEARRRQDAIERARMLQYFDKDDVKAFHTQLLLSETLKERDAQIQLKKLRKEAMALKNKHDTLEALQRWDEEDRRREAQEKALIAAQRDLAIQLQKTYKVKIDEKEKSRLATLAEGKAVLQSDANFKDEKHSEEIQHRRRQENFRQELKDLIAERKAFVKKMQEEENNLFQNSNRWLARKEMLLKKKEAVDEERFQRKLQQREKMGEEQYRLLKQEETKIDTWAEHNWKESNDRAERLIKERAEARKKSMAEMRSQRDAMLKRKEEEKKQALITQRLVREENEKLKQLEEEAQEKKRLAILAKGKELQRFHTQQMKKEANAKALKAEMKHHNEERSHKVAQEDAEFRRYARGIIEEWAGAGKSVKPFEKLFPVLYGDGTHGVKRKNKTPVPMSFHGDTKTRLGFAPSFAPWKLDNIPTRGSDEALSAAVGDVPASADAVGPSPSTSDQGKAAVGTNGDHNLEK